MLARSKTFATCTLAALLGCTLTACGTTAGPVFPTEYRAGPVPVPYQPFNYTAFPYGSPPLQDVTDGSPLTFTELHGLDNALQDNGYRVDTGTFYLFKYRIDPRADSFRIAITAKMDPFPTTPTGFFEILALTPNGVTANSIDLQTSVLQPREFGVTFRRNSNTGNESLGVGIGLDSLQTADGSLRIVLAGGYAASLNQTGSVSTTLYDVSASYTVPEPGVGALAAGTMLTFGSVMRRRPMQRN